jgi:molecular chaperone DnaK (HSP70)
MSKIIGIDLGTSNSAAAVMVGGKLTIIQSAEGNSIGLKLDHQSDNAENWPGPGGTTPKVSSKTVNTTIR